MGLEGNRLANLIYRRKQGNDWQHLGSMHQTFFPTEYFNLKNKHLFQMTNEYKRKK